MSQKKNRVVVITGGSHGIGKVTAEIFADNDDRVIILDLKNPEESEDSFSNRGKTINSFNCDITDTHQVSEVTEMIISEYGNIDILVNNAGIIKDAMIHKMDFFQWEQVINTNLTGTYNMIRAVAGSMRQAGYGRIINMSSSSAYGNIGQTNYAASKAGIIGLTKSLAKELGRFNITVNCILPGYISTGMSSGIPQKVIDNLIINTPLGRAGKPEEVGRVIEFLASEYAAFITGAEIPVTGGMLII